MGERPGDRTRRAALRRHQAVGLRQRAWRRGVPAVHRGEVGRLWRGLNSPYLPEVIQPVKTGAAVVGALEFLQSVEFRRLVLLGDMFADLNFSRLTKEH